MYVRENRGRGFQTIYWRGVYGPLAIENHLFPDRRLGEQSRVMFCPEATEAAPRWRVNPNSPGYIFPGGVFRPWGHPETESWVDYDQRTRFSP